MCEEPWSPDSHLDPLFPFQFWEAECYMLASQKAVCKPTPPAGYWRPMLRSMERK